MDPTTPRTALSSSGALRSKAAAGERKYRNSSNVPSIRWTITTRTIRQGGPRRKPASVAESSYDVLGTARRAQCRRRGRRRRGLRAPPPGRGRPEPSRGLRGRVRAGDRAGGAGRGPRAGSAVARLAGARALESPARRRRLVQLRRRAGAGHPDGAAGRSEEHTSELQSPCNLVCRLLLEKKKKKPSPRDLRLSSIKLGDPHPPSHHVVTPLCH